MICLNKMYKYLLLIVTSFYVVDAQDKKDTINVSEVVILNNRLQTPLSKENRNVEVLTKATIENLPVKTIQELLQYVSGIDLRQRGPFGSQADISVDGGSFEQTLVLLNGVKIIDHQTSHNTLNLPLPLEVIERIEIVRGPAARIYGNNSLTGVINIITQIPSENSFYGNTYFGTNFKKDKEESNHLFTNRGIQIGGNLAYANQQHQLYISHDKGNGYRYNTAFENNKLYYQGNFKFNANHSLMASYGYIKNDFGANGFYAAPGDINSKEIVETSLVILKGRNQLSRRLILTPSLSYRYNFDDYRYFKNDLNRARSKHYSNAINGQVDAVYQLNNGQIGFGIEYRNEQINSTSIKQHTRDNFGIYAEYKVDVLPKLNVNVGSYLNYNSQYGWKAYPGLDLGYAIMDNLKLIANVGTSQRIPSFTDLYLDQHPGNVGNAFVKPEKSFQTEVGFKFKQQDFSVNAYYFYRSITDFIDWVRLTTDQPWQPTNFSDFKTNGLNIKADYQFKINLKQQLKIGLSYAYLDPKFKNVNNDYSSKYKIESLKHQLINTIDYKLNKTNFMLVNRYNTRQSYQSYWVTDLKINQRLTSKFNLYLDVQNIFNTTYREIGAIPLPSRWMSFGVKFIGL